MYRLLFLVILLTFTGCANLPLDRSYLGPPSRPPELDTYYSHAEGYTSFKEEVVAVEKRYTQKRIVIETAAGPITLDYFQRKVPSDSLVFVFPVLGGKKNLIENYFAQTFASRGFDAAIVHRHEDFKKPEGFPQIEDTLKKMVVRDRIAIDFFEKEYAKKEFGTFGISRGAINVAMSAGVDPRLKHNVLAMGGTDLVGVFRDSNERKIGLYKKAVMDQQKLSAEEFYAYMEERIKTDPKMLAKYMDARNTLLFLAVFDSSVPFKFGQQLRADIGNPRAVYLLAGHRTSVLFTELPNHVKPLDNFPIMPFDYIETEAVAFYDKSFRTGRRSARQAVYEVLQSPFSLIAQILDLFGSRKKPFQSRTSSKTSERLE